MFSSRQCIKLTFDLVQLVEEEVNEFLPFVAL